MNQPDRLANLRAQYIEALLARNDAMRGQEEPPVERVQQPDLAGDAPAP